MKHSSENYHTYYDKHDSEIANMILQRCFSHREEL